jgi:hypothetical protein
LCREITNQQAWNLRFIAGRDYEYTMIEFGSR